MLEKYKDKQPILYDLLSNAIKNDKLSHAYLFETNNNPDSLDIIYSFIKGILCSKNGSCDNCNICSRIDSGNIMELKVINPDGLYIKKEQMSELQEEFSKVSLEINKKIYIINECEKMNLQASNSILKFLEEPVDNIIAILVTNNINKVLKTIISRCQVVSLNKGTNEKKDTGFENIASLLTSGEFDRNNFLSDNKIKEMYNDIISFIEFYEDNGSDTVVYLKKMWHDKFKDRQDNVFAIDIMINFYYDVLKYMINGQVSIFVDRIELIKKVSVNKQEVILNRLELLVEVKKLISNNLNMNLLIDYMIIMFGRR